MISFTCKLLWREESLSLWKCWFRYGSTFMTIILLYEFTLSTDELNEVNTRNNNNNNKSIHNNSYYVCWDMVLFGKLTVYNQPFELDDSCALSVIISRQDISQGPAVCREHCQMVVSFTNSLKVMVLRSHVS